MATKAATKKVARVKPKAHAAKAKTPPKAARRVQPSLLPDPGKMRYARLLLGMTQKDVAEKVGIDSSYISYIEQGDRPVRPSLAKAIAEALGTTLERAVRDGVFKVITAV